MSAQEQLESNLRAGLDKYELISSLGFGDYGTVTLAKEKDSGQLARTTRSLVFKHCMHLLSC